MRVKVKLIKIYILIIILFQGAKLNSRSIHRKIDSSLAKISAKWSGELQEHTFIDSHIRELPIFKTYNENYFKSKILPKGKISFKYESEKFVESVKLDRIIENFLQEIQNKKNKFKDFVPLKRRDFNKFTNCGLNVMKFKNYPFVLKIFTETPESLTDPYSKAFQERGVFVLGGSLRHVMGFTRVRNIDLIKEKIEKDPYWSKRIDLPRKWFWLPKNPKYIEISGLNIGNKKKQKIIIPATYGIICDEIRSDIKNNSPYKQEFLNLCTFLDYTLDANPKNFKIDANGTMVIIDTEHFTTLIGIQKKIKHFYSYVDWYLTIASKYIKENFMSPKNYRYERQNNTDTDFPLF